MKIDLTVVLNNFAGEPMGDADGPMTLRRAVQLVLTTSINGDSNLTAELKVKLWNMARQTIEDEVDWTPEDVVLVRDRIGKAYGPAVVGPAFELLG